MMKANAVGGIEEDFTAVRTVRHRIARYSADKAF
jgi:hypothetical protein